MRLFSPIIGILIRDMVRVGNYPPVRDRVTTQLVGHDIPRLTAMNAQ
jgi:hypothetical protein